MASEFTRRHTISLRIRNTWFFREVDSAYLGRSLPDVGFAVINGSWAVKSKLSPEKDAFILEGADSDFANVLALRTKINLNSRLSSPRSRAPK